MRISSAKAKGRRAAAETRELLLKHAPGLLPDDILVTSSSVTGEDLRLSPAAAGIYRWCFEIKNQERLNIWDAIRQAFGHADATGRRPAVVFRRNRSDLFICLRLSDFLEEIHGSDTASAVPPLQGR